MDDSVYRLPAFDVASLVSSLSASSGTGAARIGRAPSSSKPPSAAAPSSSAAASASSSSSSNRNDSSWKSKIDQDALQSAVSSLPPKYFRSCDIDKTFRLKIDSLEGLKSIISSSSSLPPSLCSLDDASIGSQTDMYVECQLFSSGSAISLPVRTAFKALNRDLQRWGQWLSFPNAFQDIPLDTVVCITVWDIFAPNRDPCVVGGTTLPLFSKRRRLKAGKIRLRLWQCKTADAGRFGVPSSTKGKLPQKDSMARLEKMTQEWSKGKIPRVEWLDRMTFSEINDLNKQSFTKLSADFACLLVELPCFEYPVVYSEREEKRSGNTYFSGSASSPASSSASSASWQQASSPAPFQPISPSQLLQPLFPLDSSSKDDQISSPSPDSASAAAIQSLAGILAIGQSVGIDNDDEDDDDEDDFAKGLTSVLISNPKQASASSSSIQQQQQPRILSPSIPLPIVFSPPGVSFCYDPEASDIGNGRNSHPVEEMTLKLALSLHLGQADRNVKPTATERRRILEILRYPPIQDLTMEDKKLLWKLRYYLLREKKALVKFLKCVDWDDAVEFREATKLIPQWQPVDYDDALELLGNDFKAEVVRKYAVDVLRRADDEELMCILLQLVQALRNEPRGEDSDLAHFLIQRCAAPSSSKSFALANYFHWFLQVEKDTDMYATLADRFQHALQQTREGIEMKNKLKDQHRIVDKLTALSRALKLQYKDRPKRIEGLRTQLADKSWNDVFAGATLPLNPNLGLRSVLAEKSYVFKSAKSPISLVFQTDDPEIDNYQMIFKTGDDMRQDQLVIQLISLMDQLLKKNGLDLKLTPYRVLATSSQDGMLECVPSVALAQVIQDHRGEILKFFATHHPDPRAEYNVSPEVLDTFIKSSAGYCVITYILGVGDRHLDNLLLTTSGHLFHIDFGFILGRDPKPFPPPMKLCKEMVMGMGGAQSRHYSLFKSYCCEAFNILRKSASLILNLLLLMVNANIPDISGHPDEKKPVDPKKNILKVQEKFRLDLSDERAIQYFQEMLNDSLKALFPQITETIHRWAQYWRS